ncbi:MAG: DUF1223 domain-containing protein [Alphaproteobacteria bacterium]|nr:DUF1223 domain-containing protein [Alphaproteobacteria bacterium]MCD8526140.1 DUF1223 domain-containing protein [Alphaproteobacteria bacterium]
MIRPAFTRRFCTGKAILTLACLISVLCVPAFLKAEEAAAVTEPVAAAEKEADKSLSPPALSVVELFSSRACVFCPEANQYFHSLLDRPGVIGLACHVSYFEADKTSLTRDFCVERQSYYNDTLHLGPNYTPQMIINGAQNAVGYQQENVGQLLEMESSVAPLLVGTQSIQNGSYQIKLPALDQPANHELLVALIDRPHRLEGVKGEASHAVYQNIVSAMISAGDWDGSARTIDIKVDLRAENKGFVVLAQNKATARITAAGRYLITKEKD